MRLEHGFELPGAVASAWAGLLDASLVASCFPGATLDSVDGNDFAGRVRLKLGPIALTYAGTGNYAETDAVNHRLVLTATGQESRGNGSADATFTVELAAAGSGTAVSVRVDLELSGTPGHFGADVFTEAGDRIVVEFATCLAATLPLDVPAAIPDNTPPPPAELRIDRGAVGVLDSGRSVLAGKLAPAVGAGVLALMALRRRRRR